jgi:hypothetical protein
MRQSEQIRAQLMMELENTEDVEARARLRAHADRLINRRDVLRAQIRRLERLGKDSIGNLSNFSFSDAAPNDAQLRALGRMVIPHHMQRVNNQEAEIRRIEERNRMRDRMIRDGERRARVEAAPRQEAPAVVDNAENGVDAQPALEAPVFDEPQPGPAHRAPFAVYSDNESSDEEDVVAFN